MFSKSYTFGIILSMGNVSLIYRTPGLPVLQYIQRLLQYKASYQITFCFLLKSRFVEPEPNEYFYYLCRIPAFRSMHTECGKKVISIGAEQKEATVQKAAMTIRYGKTLCRVIFRFAERGTVTMSDKVLKLIRSNSICGPTS